MVTECLYLGNYKVKSKEDVPNALEALKDRPLYAEKWAKFKMVGGLLSFPA